MALDTSDSGDGSDSLPKRVIALEKSVQRLRLALYCGLSLLLIAVVLATVWLFKQSVQHVDEAFDSMQTQTDKRVKAIRLNVEGELKEIRDQLKAIGGERLPEKTGAQSTKAPTGVDD